MTKAIESDRMREFGTAPLGKLLWKYSLPAVVGTVVMSLYHIIDSVVIGHAVDDPNVVSGIAITFPVMNISAALGMLVGTGATTRISIVMGQHDKPRAERILGNSLTLTIVIGLIYMSLFAIFLDPILRAFGASDQSLPYAREFMLWVIPGLVLINLTFNLNNVMRASGYPQKAMWTNFIGAGLNMILAPIFLFGFGLGVKGAALATDISMLVTAVFVMWHFFDQKKELSFKPGTYKLDRRIVQSVLAIGLAPFLINMAGSLINAIINNTLYLHGGDNAIAAVVVFNRYVTIFVMTVIGICQGMQPIVGYNYGAGKYDRLFRTFWLAAAAGFVVTVIGSAIGRFAPRPIAQMFMQDEQQIVCAIDCLQITAMGFWMVGYQIVATNFFQALGMAGKSIFLSLSRQIIFMIPLLMVLPSMWQLDGVWAAYPISDVLATIVTSIMLFIQIRRIKAKGRNRMLSDQQL